MILSCISVSADNENDLGDVSGAYSLGDNLPDDVKKSLEEIGVSSEDFSTISNLSFGNDVVMLSQAKLGVLLGTMVAGIWGCIILHFTLPKQQ